MKNGETKTGEKDRLNAGARFIKTLQERGSLFLDYLPALAAGVLILRAAELLAGLESGTGALAPLGVFAAAAGLDLLGAVRWLLPLFLFTLPLLRDRSRRALTLTGAFWSLLLAAQYVLSQYFLKSGVPLGADLFAYSPADILQTVRGAGAFSVPLLAGLPLALAALWRGLFLLKRRPWAGGRLTLAVLTVSLAALLLPAARQAGIPGLSEYSKSLALNKSAYFLEDALSYFSPLKKGPRPAGAAAGIKLGTLDPAYPFLHEERTYDSLGPFFKKAQRPPNLVFVIVEGLGRAFSGPGTSLGSFTPELDALSAEGLYWENFLGNQGRTFGVLTSVFGSMPFGRSGLAELGEKMPEHMTLFSVLKEAGYRLKVYCGFNSDFDNDRTFYARNGVHTLIDELNFGPGYKKSNSWGYADRELVSRVIAGETAESAEPFVTTIKTCTMHTPYRFIGQDAYSAAFEKHLDSLGVAPDRRAAYNKYRDIYTSILYTDKELARLISGLKKQPAWSNTVVVITGDHRLPELPMSTTLDRYHVPLLILSPLLKAPGRFKSVSSHLDITPSLLAFLAHGYGIKTPAKVAWLGQGLDMRKEFRNVHSIPLKHTKTNLVDFVSEGLYLHNGTLYRLGDQMRLSNYDDPEALAAVKRKFDAFRLANQTVADKNAILPPGHRDGKTVAYAQQDRLRLPENIDDIPVKGLSVREVLVPESARPGNLTAEVTFTNHGAAPSPAFVPLAILLTEANKEISETYGSAQQLSSDGAVTVRFDIKSENIPVGRYFLAVIPSHPDTGKPVGAGKYRVPVRLSRSAR